MKLQANRVLSRGFAVKYNRNKCNYVLLFDPNNFLLQIQCPRTTKMLNVLEQYNLYVNIKIRRYQISHRAYNTLSFKKLNELSRFENDFAKSFAAIYNYYTILERINTYASIPS